MKKVIKELLKKSGYKLTKPRKEIVSWISGQKGIFSVNELLRDLPHLDKVSVYRAVELFRELDLIHPVLNQHGEVHYELHGDAHHHHAVCTTCEKTACIPCEVKEKKVFGFANIHHSFNITGTCVACAV